MLWTWWLMVCFAPWWQWSSASAQGATLHRLAFDGIPSPALLIDDSFRIIDVSRSYLNVLNMSRDACIGLNICDLTRERLYPEQAASMIAQLVTALETRRSHQFEVRDRSRGHFWKIQLHPWQCDAHLIDSSLHRSSVSQRVWRRLSGRKQDLLTMQVIDLTGIVSQSARMLQTATSADLYHKIVNNIRDYAIFMLNPSGDVMSWNSGAENILQYNKEEIIGHHFSIFFRPEDKSQGEAEEELKQAAVHAYHHLEAWRVRKDGSHFLCAISLQPIYSDGDQLLGFVKVTQDLTQRKEAEQAMMIAHDQAADLKQKFLATASHELRSPLTSVLAGIDLLLHSAESAEALLKDQHETLDIIQHAGSSLSRIVNDLLDYTKLEAKVMTVSTSKIKIRDMMHALISEYQKRSRVPLYINIAHDVPLVMICDQSKLQQVVSNLLDNAIKFTKRGRIDITVSPRYSHQRHATADHYKMTLLVAIEDTGIGLSADQMDRIFVPFSQADETIAGIYGGTGLGLSICKQCVELMKGRIWVESTKDVGSQFKFTMEITVKDHDTTEEMNDTADIPTVKIDNDLTTDDPSPATKRPSLLPKHSSSSCLAPCLIVIVDDNPTIRNVLARIVQYSGLRSIEFADGQEAYYYFVELDLAQQQTPSSIPFVRHIVLMDIEMPILNGFDASRRILALPTTRNVPIVGVTANALKGDRQACLDAGMVGYLSKPFTIKQVTDQIHQLRLSVS